MTTILIVEFTMAKAKQPKARSVPNKHLHSRVSYLYQAANYLSSRQATATIQSSSQPISKAKVNIESSKNKTHQDIQDDKKESHPLKQFGLPNHLLSHLLGVSRKTQIHLTPKFKHTFCKRCNSILVTGSTSSTRVENISRNGKKPWADVLVIKCLSCEAEKRFPTGAQRQKRKTDRTKEDIAMAEH